MIIVTNIRMSDHGQSCYFCRKSPIGQAYQSNQPPYDGGIKFTKAVCLDCAKNIMRNQNPLGDTDEGWYLEAETEAAIILST